LRSPDTLGQVDLQERLQLDAARHQVAKVKARTRPWRYIFAIILAIVAASVSVQARYVAHELSSRGGSSESVLAPLGSAGNLGLSYGAAIAFCLLAGAGTLGLGNKAREVLERSVGSAHATVVRFVVLVAGALVTVIITLELFNVAITQLIVGGVVTSVLLGIAAQQSLANVFAGIVLLMARPFRVGDQIGVRSGALSGLLEGMVSEISITYVRLETPNGPVHIPNSQVLAAAVGPAGAVPSPGGQAAPSGGQAAPSGGQAAPSGGQAAPSGGQAAPSAGQGAAAPTGPAAGTSAPLTPAETAAAAGAPALEHPAAADAQTRPGAAEAPAGSPGPGEPVPEGSQPERDAGRQQ
jgi:Mechanosensitive ion channel, beta-domain